MLQGYKNAKTKTKSQKDTVLFIKQKLDAAKWFIDAIKQRQQTLFVTMSSIMNYQKEYFMTGDERKLRPMILKDIADEIDMDVSHGFQSCEQQICGHTIWHKIDQGILFRVHEK